MQSVTLKFDGQLYDLGQILPLQVGGQTQFLIIPTFEFRPPFLCLRLLHCHRRMELIAVEKLKAGHSIPKIGRVGRSNVLKLSPEHLIEVTH